MGERLDRDVLRLAGILILGVMGPLLAATVTTIAIPTLGRELDAQVSTVQWVGTGYLLALAMTVPITGWLVERFGARQVWLGALVVFLVGSLLSGSAWDIDSLVAFRVVQGVGAGLILPVMQTLIMRAAAGRQLGRLMAVISLPAVLGPALGPVAGGLLVAHLGWRWTFLVNLPITALAIALAVWRVPADRPSRRHRLDVTGLVLLSPALAAIIYGLVQIGHGGHPLAPLAIGVVLLAGFVVRALRTPDPLIDLRLFGIRSFGAANALLFMSGLALFGVLFLLPLFYQQLRGTDVVVTGLLLAPQGLGSLLARAAGPLVDRLGPRPVVVVSLALSAAGIVPFALADAHTSEWVLAPALVVLGVGLSAVNIAVLVGAYRDLSGEQIPHASSTTRIMQQLGGAFGTAVLAVILQSQLDGHSGATAFDTTFRWVLVFTAVAVVPALSLPRRHTSTVAAVSAGRPRG
ncbi:MDR family MFS transporter [Actinophytocola sp.]|uniref:MDR family MFS transporter n=1 Tax=Actinophytocola sp. TaxID=1872138 RepID=UPI003899C6B4